MDGTRGALFCVTCDRRVTQRLLAGVKSAANSYASLWRSETPATNVACNGATSFSHFRVWRCRRSRSLPRCMIAAPHARTRAHSLHCCRISTDTARVIERDRMLRSNAIVHRQSCAVRGLIDESSHGWAACERESGHDRLAGARAAAPQTRSGRLSFGRARRSALTTPLAAQGPCEPTRGGARAQEPDEPWQ